MSCRRLILVLALSVLAACSPKSPRHLLLVTVDTLRADHLSLYGYSRATSPVIDELGKRSVVFENAWVQWPKTTPSMVSMFSGTYPHENGIVILASHQWLDDDVVLLPEVLRDRGFATAGVVANGVLGRESNFPQGFDVYRELWLEKDTRAEKATEVALEELRRLAATGDRFFLWVHYIDPHWPYEPPPGYADPFLNDGKSVHRHAPLHQEKDFHGGIPRPVWERSGGVDDVAWYEAQYDGEIRYLDEHLGRLLDGLEETGVERETLVAVTADHGEALGEHDYYFDHGHFVYESDVRVPLLIHWPGDLHGGLRIQEPVELLGLAPTLIEALGLPRPSGPLGRSGWLAGIEGPDRSGFPEVVFSASGGEWTRKDASYTFTIRKGPFKLIHSQSEHSWELAHGQRLELYDLSKDPAEKHNLAPRRPKELRELLARLNAWLDASPPIAVQRREQRYTQETEENLRALGYL